MGTILVAMPKISDSENIVSAVRDCGNMHDIEVCTTGSEVLRVSNERDYGVVICMKKLHDMSYADLVEYLPVNFAMIVLTGDVSLEMLGDNMIKLMMPFKRRELNSVIETIMGDLYYRIRRKKRIPPKRRQEDQKLIDDAKQMLMERNGMTEPEAFRYLQKSSMDNGRTMVESAQMLLLLNEE